ncbi:hypothetical protein Tco_0053985 [Tanacetum coccineum]
MNYKPVVAGNQFNGNSCTKACDDAGKARRETVPGKDYILLPLWPTDPLLSQNSKNSPDAGFKPSGDNEKKVTEEPGKEGGDSSNDQEKEDDNKNPKRFGPWWIYQMVKGILALNGSSGTRRMKEASDKEQSKGLVLKGTHKKKGIIMMKFLLLLPELKQLGYS